MSGINFEYEKFPILLAASQDPAKIKVVIGPAGTAKTSWAAVELFRHALTVPAKDGVRMVRSLVVRVSYQQLITNTVPSYRKMLGDIVEISEAVPPRGRAKIGLPDGTVLSWEINFLSMDTPESVGKILGFEPDNAHIDEVSATDNESLILAVARRIGRTSLGGFALLTTNGPIEGHWLHKWYLGERKELFDSISGPMGRPFVSMYRQPPALLRVLDERGETIRWEENPLAENIQNLAEGYAYYFAMLADDEADIKAYVEGEFAKLKTGARVHKAFNALHKIKRESFMATWSGSSPLLIAQDYGRTPALLIAVERPSGGITVIDEVLATDKGSAEFWADDVLPRLGRDFARSWLEEGWDDPAGWSAGEASNLSAHSAATSAGAPYNTKLSNKLEPRIGALQKLLTTLAADGKPAFQVLDNCKMLINALERDYIYVTGANGELTAVPTKTHKLWASDIANAAEYLALGYITRFGGPEEFQRGVAMGRRGGQSVLQERAEERGWSNPGQPAWTPGMGG